MTMTLTMVAMMMTIRIMIIPFTIGRTRHSNRYDIWKPYARSKILKYFFFWHRNVDDWNTLPNDVVEADNVTKFMRLLCKHLSDR